MNYYRSVNVTNYINGVIRIDGIDRREVSLGDVDISYLVKKFPEISFHIDHYTVCASSPYWSDKNFFLRFNLLGVHRMNGGYTIISLEDEYYLLTAKVPYKMGAETKYYLCDQLSGLVRCIQDIVYGGVNESILFKEGFSLSGCWGC